MPDPRKKRCFRFEEMWLLDLTCGEMVDNFQNSTREPNPSIARKKLLNVNKN